MKEQLEERNKLIRQEIELTKERFHKLLGMLEENEFALANLPKEKDPKKASVKNSKAGDEANGN